MLRFLMSVGMVLPGGLLALAQDVESGPDKGARVPALKVFDATGENMDKNVDYAALRKDRTTLYLLIAADRFGRPMNRFMKTLDTKVKKDFADTYIVAVWLTDDLAKTKAFLPRVQTSVQYETTALTCVKGVEGPKGWNVNTDAHITVVLASKGKVLQRWGYNSVNETDVRAVVAALGKAKGKAKKK